jgi:hypothetical protein
MEKSIKFKAIHKSGKEYWFDLMWGQSNIQGAGYIGMVEAGGQLTTNRYKDGLTLVDPTECDIMPLNDDLTKSAKLKCCKIGCDYDAEYHIQDRFDGATWEDYTMACSMHLEELLPDKGYAEVWRVKKEI